MPKAKGLRERAEHRADRDYDMLEERASFVTGYLAGHRANRLTAKERAVVEAAKIMCASVTEKEAAEAKDGMTPWARLAQTVSNLDRAKGRK